MTGNSCINIGVRVTHSTCSSKYQSDICVMLAVNLREAKPVENSVRMTWRSVISVSNIATHHTHSYPSTPILGCISL